MAKWEVSEPSINVWPYDEPLGYQPGLGPRISFKLAYKQREARFLYDGVGGNYTGVGPAWHCSWVSYLYRNYSVSNNNGSYTTNYDGTATVVMGDGGQRIFTANSVTTEYFSHGTMTHTANPDGSWDSATINYPDGSKEEYATVTTAPVRIGGTEILYRTAKYDRFGNVTRYDFDTNEPLLHYVVDSDSRTNTLSYTGKLITSVQDPFGRTAYLTYDNYGWLTNITDVQGMSSSFTYDENGWVTDLQTPYGNTSFEYVDYGFDVSSGECAANIIRAVRVRDAGGGTNAYALIQHLAPHLYQAPIPNPTGVGTTTFDSNLGYRDSLYWGPRAAAHLQGLLV